MYFTIMLALCLMLSVMYHVQYYAGIIGRPLAKVIIYVRVSTNVVSYSCNYSYS